MVVNSDLFVWIYFLSPAQLQLVFLTINWVVIFFLSNAFIHNNYRCSFSGVTSGFMVGHPNLKLSYQSKSLFTVISVLGLLIC